MEENKIVESKIESQETAITQEKPKNKSYAALVLGIIGTSTGILALILIIGGFFFRGARNDVMGSVFDGRNGRIETRGIEARGDDDCGPVFIRGAGR